MTGALPLRIANRDARRLWLNSQGLAAPPTGSAQPENLTALIEKIGFVQLDTIRVIARAHDHILWSRRQQYREGMLDRLVAKRSAFEHFTHDASVLPMSFYPYWRRQFDRMRRKIERHGWDKVMASHKERKAILARIAEEGPLSTKDFESGPKKSDHAWARPPHKYALDYFWYAGVLATCHRKNFVKQYHLREMVIPLKVLAKDVSDDRQIDWLCKNALQRLSFGTEGEIQRFWDAVSLEEVKAWSKNRRRTLIEVEIECADKSIMKAVALADIEERLAMASKPTRRLRILNPFDPVVRDRNRLTKLFGFDYRIEIFVPAAKRQYGYYVYPLLEGDRFVGRIEARVDRKAGALTLNNVWWEPKIKASPARRRKLETELNRIARFVGVTFREPNFLAQD
ncbi:MAG: crosslink repair DNA glycosylase YcaQ family protein [Pseudomonadota bacterium]